jgi:AhpD family alkylhydroperoxidase
MPSARSPYGPIERPPHVAPRSIAIDGVKIFYREAGDPAAPTLLLLHGFPTSSHQFRHLIPALADKYHVIAPDLPGFGFSDVPARDAYSYTFDNLAKTMGDFIDALGLTRYAIYVFDYGAPIGFRLALRNPERISAIITQNGNAYLEGVSAAFNPVQAYWADPSEANRAALRGFLALGTTVFQYSEGVADPSVVEPEAYTLDQALLDRPGVDEIQLDLLLDYQSNVALYPAIQAYFREHTPPTLAVWGKNDPFFIPAGAEAFKRDNPKAEVRFVDSGHFPLESKLDDVVAVIRPFLAKTLDKAGAALFADLTEATAPAASLPLLAKTAEIFGFIPNLAVKMGADPASLDGYLSALHAFTQTTALTPIEQQIVLIAASRANDAGYSVAVHATVAGQLGADPALIKAAASGGAIADARIAALRDLTVAITVGRGQLSDGAIDAATKAGLARAEIVAIAFGVAVKAFANTIALIARPDLDPAFAAALA